MAYLRLLAVLAAASYVAAVPNQHRENPCCSKLEELLPGKVVYSGDSVYESEQGSYYSLIQADLEPACRVEPSSTEEVVTIVKLAGQEQCQFAVRSGGHMTFKGASNIGPEGFTLDTTNLTSLELSEDKTTVAVGTGNRWGAVFDLLTPQNLTVVGGRDPYVGVGGYLLGGGISFYSYQKGFAGDNVANHEVVLSTGEVVNANSSHNSELHWALKLGSNNFGIVTKYDLYTYPQGLMWSGNQVFNYSDARDILEQYPDFVDHVDENPSSAALGIPTFVKSGDDYIFQVSQAYYTDEAKPAAWQTLIGDGFDPIQDTMGVKNFTQVMSDFGDPNQARTTFYGIILDAHCAEFFVDNYSKGREIFGNGSVADAEGLVIASTLQPMTHYMRTLGSSPVTAKANQTQDNWLLMLYKIDWKNAEDDEVVQTAIDQWTSWGEVTAADRGLLQDWLYMNYCDGSQDVYGLGTTEEDLEKMISIRDKYDPEGIYKNLWKGGHKLPQ